jgi:hypothetical protein
MRRNVAIRNDLERLPGQNTVDFLQWTNAIDWLDKRQTGVVGANGSIAKGCPRRVTAGM